MIGQRIRIITDEDYRIMSPPRTPRGEKPATTIRLLRRTLADLQRRLLLAQSDSSDREKVIAGYDVQLSEANDENERLLSITQYQSRTIGDLEQHNRQQAERLAFLEGYYAKSQETAPSGRLSAPRTFIAGDPAETDAGRREGDTPPISVGRLGGATRGQI